MRVRLRSLESKETLKFEVPNSCSLQELKETLSRAISSPSSSLHLSLNRKDEIHSSSPDESLHSIGITAGDLIFYTSSPNAFSSQTLVHKPGPSHTESTAVPTTPGNSHETLMKGKLETMDVDTGDALPEAEAGMVSYARQGGKQKEHSDMLVGSEEKEELSDMTDDGSFGVSGKWNSEPSFMKKVLREALGNDVNDQKVLVIVAVHAVILESGFVRLDSVSAMAVGHSYLMNELPSSASTISLRYTLPEILTDGSVANNTVILKFQTLGHLVTVYGSLSDGSSGLHRLCLDKCKFAPALDLMLAKCDLKNSMNNVGDNHKNEVFNFWKIVKDGLALPLLIDLCEKAGLGAPPCFMRLPTELKLKILEYLPGVDVARVGSLCSELRYLSSNNDLWKQKFDEEFGEGSRGRVINSYKDLFAQYWERKKSTERALAASMEQGSRYFPVRREPRLFVGPSIPMVGGDHDRLPGCFVLPTFRQPDLRFHGFQPRRTFSPSCYLGGGFNIEPAESSNNP